MFINVKEELQKRTLNCIEMKITWNILQDLSIQIKDVYIYKNKLCILHVHQSKETRTQMKKKKKKEW